MGALEIDLGEIPLKPLMGLMENPVDLEEEVRNSPSDGSLSSLLDRSPLSSNVEEVYPRVS